MAVETPDRVLPQALSATAATILTAGAAGTYYIVRHITLANVTSVDVRTIVGLANASGDTLAKRIVPNVLVPAYDTIEWDGYRIMKGHASTPDLLYALCETASAVNISIDLVSGV